MPPPLVLMSVWLVCHHLSRNFPFPIELIHLVDEFLVGSLSRFSFEKSIEAGYLSLCQRIFPQLKASIDEKKADKIIALTLEKGHVHLLQWLEQFERMNLSLSRLLREKCWMDIIASKGDLVMIQWLKEKKIDGICTSNAMDHAAMNGHLRMVQWLHFHRPEQEGCTTWAMDLAAEKGFIEIVQWLHTNRNEGCTKWAMDHAASNGHLEMVQWLHANRQEGCTTYAVDMASQNGHLEMVQWLFRNRIEKGTKDALLFAARFHHLEIMQFLYTQMSISTKLFSQMKAYSNGNVWKQFEKWHQEKNIQKKQK